MAPAGFGSDGSNRDNNKNNNNNGHPNASSPRRHTSQAWSHVESMHPDDNSDLEAFSEDAGAFLAASLTWKGLAGPPPSSSSAELRQLRERQRIEQDEYIEFRRRQRQERRTNHRLPTPSPGPAEQQDAGSPNPEADENGRFPAQFGLGVGDSLRIKEVFGPAYSRDWLAPAARGDCRV
jgi:hypothetical protein